MKSPVSFEANPTFDAERMYRGIRSHNRMLVTAFRKLDVDWPDACGLLKYLCEYVTDMFQESGESIVVKCARQAMLEYNQSVTYCRDDRQRLRVFIDALMTPLSGNLAGVSVADPVTKDRWRPDIGETLSEWLEEDGRLDRVNQLEIVESDVCAEDVKSAMLDTTLLPMDCLGFSCDAIE